MRAFLAALFFTLPWSAALAENEPWTIGPRTLPAPAGASEVIRAGIANRAQPDVAKHVRQTTVVPGKDFRRRIRAANARRGAEAKFRAKRWGVTIGKAEIAGVSVRTATPAGIDPANRSRLFVHLHGGAYVIGAGKAILLEAVLIAHRGRIPVVSIDYRMPPDHPFPAAVDDVVAVWRELLAERQAKSMALGGTSAGGGLTLAATQRFIELGLEVPGALWAGTPWADLSKTGDSLYTNEGIDHKLVSYHGLLESAAKLYADGRDLKTPLISPVYGSFKGFPPTYLVTGTRDLFLSDTVRVHRKMRVAGVVADLNVYEGVSHGDYFFRDSPEFEQSSGELRDFLLRHLD